VQKNAGAQDNPPQPIIVKKQANAGCYFDSDHASEPNGRAARRLNGHTVRDPIGGVICRVDDDDAG
jgi:hypothetical protein